MVYTYLSSKIMLHRRAHRPKVNLPAIYGTQIPNELEKLLTNGEKLIVVTAPTGYGKTVMCNAIMAKFKLHNCISLMPYRVSVHEMYKYLTKTFNHRFGYAMRGDTLLHNDDDVVLMTVGYWLSRDLFVNSGDKPTILMIDEAHDPSWQTDLALRIAMWRLKQGHKLQIIVSSATLDIASTIPQDLSVKFLSAGQAVANVEVNYLHKSILSIENNAMSPKLMQWIYTTISNITDNTDTGDILVIMPGKEEIEKLVTLCEADTNLNDYSIHTLYSGLTHDEIQDAITPIVNKRKIVIATNTVENAITIVGMTYVIDSCLRKVSHIDTEGVTSLQLTLASQSNIKQACGRVGRMGITGYAYVMITEDEYNELSVYSENEVCRNPLYSQIIRLVLSNLPIDEVLYPLPIQRIARDVKYLIAEDILTEDLQITDLGKIVSKLPLSIRAGKFVAANVDTNHLYDAIILACWIDNNSIFYRPRRKVRESKEDYQQRLDIIDEKQLPLHRGDCADTFLYVWYTSYTVKNFKLWCREHELYDKSLYDIQSSVNAVINALEELSIKVTIRKEYSPDTIEILIPTLSLCYSDRLLVLKGGKYQRPGTSITHVLRKNAIYKGDRLLALHMHRINPKLIAGSHTVKL